MARKPTTIYRKEGCAITWDDGKPEKAKRKAKRALQEP